MRCDVARLTDVSGLHDLALERVEIVTDIDPAIAFGHLRAKEGVSSGDHRGWGRHHRDDRRDLDGGLRKGRKGQYTAWCIFDGSELTGAGGLLGSTGAPV